MNDKDSNTYFPILINMKRFPVLVVGGGDIAYQKVNSLLKFNSDVTVLSPDLNSKIKEFLDQKLIKYIDDYYSSKYLKDYKVVISATNNKSINKNVYSDCKKNGILLNVVDDPELCDFILPANIQRGNLTVSISSQGKAPFYAKHFKSKLETDISQVEADTINLAEEFRSTLFSDAELISSETRRNAFKEFVSVNWENIILDKGFEAARETMRDILKKLK
jgi:precorrin-2 dehydrogenase/sirohydrochlorin ferrochelatase